MTAFTGQDNEGRCKKLIDLTESYLAVDKITKFFKLIRRYLNAKFRNC
jgi:hypothetical protein